MPMKKTDLFFSSSTSATAIAPIEENGDTAVPIAPTAIAENKSPGSTPPAATPGTRGKKVVLTTNPLTKKLIVPENSENRVGENISETFDDK